MQNMRKGNIFPEYSHPFIVLTTEHESALAFARGVLGNGV